MGQGTVSDLGSVNKRDYTNSEFKLFYERIDVAYKKINETDITTAIFVPKALIKKNGGHGHGKPANVPLIVHWHGGGLIVGAAPEPAWFPNWLQEIPVSPSTPAILLSPAYRLAPESRAYDSLQDVKDFWTWLHSSSVLGELLAPYGLAPSLSQILTVGESAGGYLAMQSSLLFQPISKVGGVIGGYPSVWPDIWGNMTGIKDPALDKIIDDYVAGLKPGSIRISSPWPELMDLTGAYLATVRVLELYGRTDEEYEFTTLKYALGLKHVDMPAIWVLQGKNDSILPQFLADEVVQKTKEAYPDLKLKYTVRDGEHGWDALYGIKRDWVAEGFEFVKKGWLKGKKH
ncbi:Tuliposide A-converting enzyme 2, chloroplastic [Podospora fimiseda]|uniref:Tuliposide A-converting enzyme 2, chloroplastic n=1 Tax=Podospora fimiseda TaxID=252190 RepID=A0AAN7BLH7_9PEZI|nr:Tuliposide A-converting enzyme 2, chloroplastic [Podospora fimiseda]